MILQSLRAIDSPHNTLQTYNGNKTMSRTSFIPKTRMQALSVLLPHKFPDSKDFAPISSKYEEDFSSKLTLDHEEENLEEEEHEFSFACANPEGPLIFADDIFHNGQIQPISHVSNQSIHFVDKQNRVTLALRPPLKKLFIEERNCISSKLDCMPYCEWWEKVTMLEVETSNESCKKSNSTGFSKHWRLRRDLNLRSNSNGQDTFVFLNPSVPASTKPMTLDDVKAKNVTKRKTNHMKHQTTVSAHEKLYVMGRKRKENGKRRSFLPYRQELVGFFANANRFSRNLHPF